MRWYHRFHQSYKTKPTRSGKIGQEHFTRFTGKNRSHENNSEHYNKAEDLASEQKPNKALKAAFGVTGMTTAAILAEVATGHIMPMATASAIFATGGAWANYVSVQRAYNKTKKDERRRSTLKKDPKTGFYKKNREWTEKEDMSAINTRYGQKGKGASNNCAICSIAYDIRRRGYDVRAKKATTGYTGDETESFYKNAKGHDKPLFGDNDTYQYVKAVQGYNFTFASKVKNKLSEKPNTRGVLSVYWGCGGGHAIAYEVDTNGKVTLRDCQSNQKADFKTLRFAYDASYFRTDNLEPDYKKLKEILE